MGLRAKVESTCDVTPMPGTIAMYTSGCPKNQKRCCQSSVDPPEWGCIWSLMTILLETKKLVPATWSRMRRMQAGINTAKAVRPMHDVMNQAQALSGKRHRLMPRVRISSVVVMKFSEPSNWPTQKMAIESAHRTTPVPSPGPPTSPIALSGAYWVQPPRVGPVPTKNEDTRTRKPTNVTQNDIMLKWGNGMSSAPTWMGRK